MFLINTLKLGNLLKAGVVGIFFFPLFFLLLSGCILPPYTGYYFLSTIEVLNAILEEKAGALRTGREPHTLAAATRPQLPWRPGPGLCWLRALLPVALRGACVCAAAVTAPHTHVLGL